VYFSAVGRREFSTSVFDQFIALTLAGRARDPDAAFAPHARKEVRNRAK
jgi:hypothetical protein